MTFYERLAATALALLVKFGGTVTLRSVSQSGAYDPSTGTQAVVTTNVDYKGALFDFKDGETTVQGELVRKGDKKLLLEPAASPTPSHFVVVNGVAYSVLSVQEIKPAGTRVLSTLHLRK